ncbi:hypothetical protein ACFL1M_04565 [Patescibacteria group bacterium]
MARNKTIVLYIFLSLISVYVFLVFFTFQTFRHSNGAPLQKSNYLLPHKQLALFKPRPTPIECQPNPSDLIYPKPFEQILSQSSYPKISCENHCILTHQNNTQINLIGALESQGTINIADQFIIDEKSNIISYETDKQHPHTRIVLDWKGNLIHWIEENPNQNKLTLRYYNPNTQMLVYHDENQNTYHYSTHKIGLYKNLCN